MAPQLFQVILTSQIAENGSLLPLGVGQFSYVHSTKPLFENPLNFFDNLRPGSNYMQSGCQHWKRTGRSATAGSEQPKLIADTNSVTNHPYPWNTSQYTETMTTYTKTLVQLLNRFRILTPSVLTMLTCQCGDLYIIHNSGLTVFKRCWQWLFLGHISLGMWPVLVSDQWCPDITPPQCLAVSARSPDFKVSARGVHKSPTWIGSHLPFQEVANLANLEWWWKQHVELFPTNRWKHNTPSNKFSTSKALAVSRSSKDQTASGDSPGKWSSPVHPVKPLKNVSSSQQSNSVVSSKSHTKNLHQKNLNRWNLSNKLEKEKTHHTMKCLGSKGGRFNINQQFSKWWPVYQTCNQRPNLQPLRPTTSLSQKVVQMLNHQVIDVVVHHQDGGISHLLGRYRSWEGSFEVL